MSPLQQAVTTLRGWGAERSVERQQGIALLQQSKTLMQDALALWQSHLDTPFELDPRRAITTLVRPDAAKRLHDIHFAAKDAARRLMALTGAPLIDGFDSCDELAIEIAYRQLKLGETLAYVTVKAVETQSRRLAVIEQALAQLLTIT